MKTLVYSNQSATAINLESILDYLKHKQINKSIDFLKENIPFDTYWDQHNDILNKGDTLVINDIAHLSTLVGSAADYIINVLQVGVDIHFVKYEIAFNSADFNLKNLIDFLQVASKQEDIVIIPYSPKRSYRIAGRPKGSKNKSLKLDIFKNEIQVYLAEGHSHSTISKLVDCHPMTLKTWLNERQASFT